MTLTRKKEIIYVAMAFFTSIGQLTWVQMAYNEPSFAFAWTAKEWAIICGISLVFVTAQTLIAWKAYLSDPNGKHAPLPEQGSPHPEETPSEGGKP